MDEELKEEYIEKIKNAIALKPGSTKIEISGLTGISILVIEKLVEEGRFEEKRGEIRTCKKSTMSNEDRKRAIEGLAKYKVDVAPIDHVKNPQDGYSKLVIDLEEKYGHNKNDSNER